MVEMTCEKCSNLYELTEDEFEEQAEHKMPYLCPVCFDDMIEAEKETNRSPKRCFEYKDIYISVVMNAETNFNKLGQNGWELVTISNDYAYFKREYFKEV